MLCKGYPDGSCNEYSVGARNSTGFHRNFYITSGRVLEESKRKLEGAWYCVIVSKFHLVSEAIIHTG